MRRRTSPASATTSSPATRASPEVGGSSVHSIRTVVVLPAPFGPRNPNTSPERTVKSMPRTASIPPLKVRRKELAAIAAPVASLLLDPVCISADAATSLTRSSQFSGVWGTDHGERENSSLPAHLRGYPVSVSRMISFDAYAQRVGVGADPSVTELHRAHVFAIPFENLDPHRGVPCVAGAGGARAQARGRPTGWLLL